MPASPDTPRNRVVSGYWLEAHLDDPSVVVVEVTSKPDDTTYRAGHIPGARWRFWKDFCWHPTDRDLVTPEAAAERLGALGVTPETTLVFYGDPVQYGTYAAWAYTMAGHPRRHPPPLDRRRPADDDRHPRRRAHRLRAAAGRPQHAARPRRRTGRAG
ncbi:MAG: rhodanese-like domain-containing protein [Rhodospirillaceae bacterium]